MSCASKYPTSKSCSKYASSVPRPKYISSVPHRNHKSQKKPIFSPYNGPLSPLIPLLCDKKGVESETNLVNDRYLQNDINSREETNLMENNYFPEQTTKDIIKKREIYLCHDCVLDKDNFTVKVKKNNNIDKKLCMRCQWPLKDTPHFCTKECLCTDYYYCTICDWNNHSKYDFFCRLKNENRLFETYSCYHKHTDFYRKVAILESKGPDSDCEEKEVKEKEVGVKEIGEEEVWEKLGEKEVGEKEVGEKEVGEKEVGEKEVGEKEVGEKEAGEAIEEEAIEEEVGKNLGKKEAIEEEVWEKFGEKEVGKKEGGEKEKKVENDGSVTSLCEEFLFKIKEKEKNNNEEVSRLKEENYKLHNENRKIQIENSDLHNENSKLRSENDNFKEIEQNFIESVSKLNEEINTLKSKFEEEIKDLNSFNSLNIDELKKEFEFEKKSFVKNMDLTKDENNFLHDQVEYWKEQSENWKDLYGNLVNKRENKGL
jgi:FtsZ-binding cell division protein ZapB